jgi:hypothetical protein
VHLSLDIKWEIFNEDLKDILPVKKTTKYTPYCQKWNFIYFCHLYFALNKQKLFSPNTEFLADSTVISNFRGTHKNNSSA